MGTLPLSESSGVKTAELGSESAVQIGRTDLNLCSSLSVICSFPVPTIIVQKEIKHFLKAPSMIMGKTGQTAASV